MPYITLVNPLVDIVLLVVGWNLFSYGMYALVFKREFSKTARVDIRLSLAELLLVIANYAPGAVVIVVPYVGETPWWLWYISVSIPIEIACLLGYKYYFKLEWSDIAGSAYKE